MKRLSLAALLAISTLGSVSTVHASDLEVSGNVGATSNYIWRGMTQTRDKGSVNGGVDLGYNGFYAGAWASSVDFASKANYELDAYAGYSNSIDDFSYDLSYTQYMYPDSKDQSDFGEVKLGLGYTLSDLSLGVSYAKTVFEEWDNGNESGYAEATASYDFKILSLDVSYGDYEDNGENYTVGVSKTVEVAGQSFDLALVYSEYNADAGSSSDQDNIYATIGYSF